MRAFAQSAENGQRTIHLMDDTGKTLVRTLVVPDGPKESLEAAVRRDIADRLRQDAVKSSVVPGVELDLTEPPPILQPEPTTDDVARKAFVAAWTAYRQTQLAVENGLLAETDAQVADAEAAMKTQWQPEFVDMLGPS
jgi:hypothetical protein